MINYRRLFFALVALGLVVAVTAFKPKASTTTLKVVEHADSDTVTDTGKTGDSVGDILAFANPVFDEKNAAQVGTDNGECFRTVASTDGAWECAWILTLKDGQITVEGPYYDTKDSVLAITGGTGSYSGARGQMTLHSRNDKGTEYDFSYEIES